MIYPHSFFSFFDRNRPLIDPDPARWPESWKIIRWTTYPRYPALVLPRPAPLPEMLLTDVLSRRKTDREFSGGVISAHELSTLLFYSCGLTKPNADLRRSRRPYPSGGALYPIELYLAGLRDGINLPAGMYHYNVFQHSLERMPGDPQTLPQAFGYPWVAEAAVVFLFAFVEGRTKPKYGNFAYKIGLIEAGHISQNFYLNAAALGLKCSALGGFRADRVHETLGLDPLNEALFYAVAVGR